MSNAMPPENSISTTDLLAVAAFLVAVLSAVYARGARDAANRANEISIRESLQPIRLQAFQAMVSAQLTAPYRPEVNSVMLVST